ncbi:putative solute carrier family 35 member G1-like [Apostichopus japonicus]|uniref:Putative solute carrier family 35 member G1-like n=1 Tax=Stichopus japonicus TaxID=307972 RepID=A0A2G8JCG0_STIJA|nr:putative solute carrier family 35 member G1-like [Apostichopus japonicus]
MAKTYQNHCLDVSDEQTRREKVDTSEKEEGNLPSLTTFDVLSSQEESIQQEGSVCGQRANKAESFGVLEVPVKLYDILVLRRGLLLVLLTDLFYSGKSLFLDIVSEESNSLPSHRDDNARYDPWIFCDNRIVFIARPYPLFRDVTVGNKFDKSTLIGAFIALFSAVGMALGVVLFRKQSQLGISQYLTILYCVCFTAGTNVLICFVFVGWHIPSVNDWLFSIAGAVCYFVAQFSLVASLYLETATMVSIFLSFEVVFSFIWQILLQGVLPLWTSYVGSILLIGASVGITLYRKKITQTETANKETQTDDLTTVGIANF